MVHVNRSVKLSTWFTKCAASRTALIFMFPEDFGGHAKSGPSSLWSLQELRSLHGQDDASRGATFLCRIAGADTKRPLGIFTNLPGLQQSLQTGWPALTRHGTSLYYSGPLPKSCGCSPPHTHRIGVTSNEDFYTHGAFLHFAARWFPTPLRMGTLRHQQCLSYSLFPRSLTLGRSSTNVGAYANSPGTFSSTSRTPSKLTSTSRDLLRSQLHSRVLQCLRLRHHRCSPLFYPQVLLHFHLALRKRS